MKKQIIILGLFIAVVIAGISLVTYLRSFHTVTVTLNQQVREAAFYKNVDNAEQITTLSQSGKVSLQDGVYYLIPKGDTISDDPIQFAVKGDTTLTVNPALSQAYMEQKLAEEELDIVAALEKAFPAAANYLVQKGTLYNNADWYGGILRLKSDARAEKDWYRVIAHKEGGQWKIIGKPSLVITKSNFSGVPQEVVDGTNNLNAEPTY